MKSGDYDRAINMSRYSADNLVRTFDCKKKKGERKHCREVSVCTLDGAGDGGAALTNVWRLSECSLYLQVYKIY